MPQNFPEIWEKKLRELIGNADQAPWLDGIAELEGDPVQLGEENLIHVPLETFTPDVLLNNTTYPIEVQEYTDGTKSLTLDKYQTKATKISDDAAKGASYDKIASSTKGHRKACNRNKFKKAAHALAPASHTALTPVIVLPDNYTSNDVYKAMVALKDAWDTAEVEEEGRRIVLASKHYNKLIEDRERFADVLVDHATGKVKQLIAGFKVYTYVSNPYYTSAGAKKAFGSVPGVGDKQATFAFVEDNVGKKTGDTKQYYDAPTTTTQSHLYNIRHYFITLPLRNEQIGVII